MIVQNQAMTQSTKHNQITNQATTSNGTFKLSNGNVVMMNNTDIIKATLGYTTLKVNLDKFENSSKVVSTMPLGTEVGVVSTVGNWSEVIGNGYRGYIPSKDILNTGNVIEVNSKTNQIIETPNNQARDLNLDLYNGWEQENGSWYYYQNGQMCTGWQQVNGSWYYMASNGQMCTGWEEVNSSWYYMSTDGVMNTGWIQVNGSWYYLNSDGQMQIGWRNINGQTYYLQSNGSMATGEVNIDGVNYLFDQNGYLENIPTNIQAISGNAIANTSVYINSLPGIGADHLATLNNGDIISLIGETGSWYKVNYNGIVGYVQKQYTTTLSAGTVTLQNTSDNNTVWETDGLTNAQLTETSVPIEAKAAQVCEGLTTDYQKAKAIYDWVATNIKYNSQEADTTIAALIEGSEAIEVFNTRSGICQGFADLYAAMCRAEGIHVKVVESNTHAWNQVYTPATGWFNVDCTWASDAYATPDVVENADGTYTNENNGYGFSTSNLQAINDPNYTSQYIDVLNSSESVVFSGNNDYFDNPNNSGWNNTAHQYEYTSSAGFRVIPNKTK